MIASAPLHGVAKVLLTAFRRRGVRSHAEPGAMPRSASSDFPWSRRLAVCAMAGSAQAAAEIKLGKDFLDGVVEKLPPTSFDKADKYRGSVHSYRLIAIDPRTRRFLIACQIEGEFHPPVTGPISERVGRSPQTPEGWRKFHFDVKARVNIEPGVDGAPRFRIEIDEVKKRELDGFSGVVAKLLGQYFDDLVTQIASGRASRLNKRLNDEVLKRVGLFKDYGVFQEIDYTRVGSGPSFRLDAVPIRRHHRLRFGRRAAGHRPPLSMVPSPRWFPLLHDPSPTHPTGPTPSPTASRVTSMTIRSPRPSRFIAGATARQFLHDRRRTARKPAAPAFGLGASLALSIAIPNREPFRSIAFTTRSGISIFIRFTRTPSSRSRTCECRCE